MLRGVSIRRVAYHFLQRALAIDGERINTTRNPCSIATESNPCQTERLVTKLRGLLPNCVTAPAVGACTVQVRGSVQDLLVGAGWIAIAWGFLSLFLSV